eukprot:GILI01048004.1.p1 GENE.GILI01048004.1~~GILI01048004.1.p1  ORF type:complete len:131 (+),score=21.83 GILI01048004.1:38-394(+)
MLNIEEEWKAQVADVGDWVTQVISVRLLSPSTLVATVLLSPKINEDVEPTCIYFDGDKGFAFLNDTEFDEEEDAVVPPSVLSRLSFSDYLLSLLQTLPNGASTFADALSRALDALADK